PLEIHGATAHVEPDNVVMYVVASSKPIFSAPHNAPVVYSIARYPPPLPTIAIVGTCSTERGRLSSRCREALTSGSRCVRKSCSSGLIPALDITSPLRFLYGLLVIAGCSP